jgi:phosphoribosylformylglycinamidine synthase subunit PurQ / glutaminase
VIFAVITFPGSNCDRDSVDTLGRVLGYQVRHVFHKENSLGPCDAVVVPGGFSYGDYLRAGALAKLSPIMEDVRRFARKGGPVIGICNGFQILCEAELLPGALIRNRALKFVSRVIAMRVENNQTQFTSRYQEGQHISMPIAHGEGCYVADAQTVEALEAEGRVIFRYVASNRDGLGEDGNPNGSTNAIAGIVNPAGNILGLMPHPERACDPAINGTDGAGIFLSMADAISRAGAQRQPAPELAS